MRDLVAICCTLSDAESNKEHNRVDEVRLTTSMQAKEGTTNENSTCANRLEKYSDSKYYFPSQG